MKRTILYVAALMSLWMYSCTFENAGEPVTDPVQAGEVDVLFRMYVPGTGSTRAIGTAQEEYIGTIDVYPFIKGGDGVYRYLGTPVQGTGYDGSLPLAEFKASVTKYTAQQKFVILVNARDAAHYGMQQGETFDACMAKLVYRHSAEWKSNSATDYDPIPMYAVTDGHVISDSNKNIGNFNLLRMMAKFTIKMEGVVADPKFKLVNACVFNRPVKGYIYYDPATNWNATDKCVLSANCPAAAGGDPLNEYMPGKTFTVNASEEIIGQIYTFEMNNSAQSDKLAKTAIVVGGYYDGGSILNYYRIDVPASVTGGNILRNHDYQIDIREAAAQGWPTPKEAYEGGSLISAKVTPWNLAGQSVIIDKEFYLTVDRNNVYLDEYVAADVTLNIETNYDKTDQGFPSGIYLEKVGATSDIKVVYDPAVAAADEWLTITDLNGTGDGDLSRQVQLSVPKNESGVQRSATIYMTAGNMTQAVKITQERFYISRYFATSNVVLNHDGTKLIFATNQYENAIVPANSQGLHFRFGSLVGVSTKTVGSTHSTELDINKDFVFLPPGCSKPTVWLSVLAADNYTYALQGDNVPYFKDEDLKYVNGMGFDAFIEAYPGRGFSEAAAIGDVCRYITDKGWVAERWRIPTAAEQLILHNETSCDAHYGTFGIPYQSINSTDGLGMEPIRSGYWLGVGVTTAIPSAHNMQVPPEGTLFWPASGYRAATTGRLYTPGASGYGWSCTPCSVSYGYMLAISSSGIASLVNRTRNDALPVRCIRETY